MRVIRITIRKILIIAGTFFLLWKYHQSENTVVIKSTTKDSNDGQIRPAGNHKSAEARTFISEGRKKEETRIRQHFNMSELEHHMTLETLELKLRDKLGSLPPQLEDKPNRLKLNLVVPCRLDQQKERNIFRSVVNNFATMDNLPFSVSSSFISFAGGKTDHSSKDSNETDVIIIETDEWYRLSYQLRFEKHVM